MRLGDLVPGPFPTMYTDIRVFPSASQILASSTNVESSQDYPLPQSIGQDAGRSSMKGALPARYYGAGWLAPNSGTVDVRTSVFSPIDRQPAATLNDARSTEDIGPITLTSPMPSILKPRSDQVTAEQVQSCAFSQFVNRNPLLAVAAAVGVFLLLRGGRNGR